MSACRVQEGVSLSYNLHLAREEMPHTHPVLQSEFLKFPFFRAPPRAAPTPRRSPRRKGEGKEGGRHADDWQKLRLKSDRRRRGGKRFWKAGWDGGGKENQNQTLRTLPPFSAPPPGVNICLDQRFSPGWLPPCEKIHAGGGETSTFIFSG